METKKSSSAGASPGSATSMNPPAPSPVSCGSATNEVAIAASAASTALPPARRICAPASAIRDDRSRLRVTRGSPRGSEKPDSPRFSSSRRGGRRSP